MPVSNASAQSSAAQSPVERTDIGTLFPGSELSHILHVVTEPSVAAVSSVLACLESSKGPNAEIQSFHVRRLPSAFDQRICVQGINEAYARRIRERLEGLNAVERVRLEHQVRVIRSDA